MSAVIRNLIHVNTSVERPENPTVELAAWFNSSSDRELVEVVSDTCTKHACKHKIWKDAVAQRFVNGIR